MAIKFFNTKYNRRLESLTEITYSEGSSGSITAFVPFSATSFNEERSSAEVDAYGRQWCSIEGMQEYGLAENIYILRLKISLHILYDSFQTRNRTAIINGLFGTKNDKMTFPFEFKLEQVGCATGEGPGGDIIFWKVSGTTDTFNRIEKNDGWSGNNYGTKFGSRELTESKMIVSHCSNLTGFYSGQKLLRSVAFENCNFSGVTSFSNMFYNCQQLESIDMSGWDFSSAYTLEAMFAGCKELTSVIFPTIQEPTCTTIGFLFMNCSSLSRVDVRGINTEHVTNMSNVFSNCVALENIDVSNFSTSNCINMVNMFKGCSSLRQLDIRNWDVSQCSNFTGIFDRCKALTNIIGGETEICGARAMVGAKHSFDLSTTDLDLASIVAIFLGIAKLDSASNTHIKINHAQKELANDYLNIARSKNWKIILE